MADTPVHFDYKAGDHSTVFAGSIWVNVVYRVHVSGNDDYIAVTNAIEYPLIDGRVDINLRPSNSTWAYKITEDFPGGVTRYVAVPTAQSAQYGDLLDVDPETLEPNESNLNKWDQVTNVIQDLYDQTRIARDNAVGLVSQKLGEQNRTNQGLYPQMLVLPPDPAIAPAYIDILSQPPVLKGWDGNGWVRI